MTYDAWKTRSPDDERDQFEAPCCETAKVDADDHCVWCGASPDEDCRWERKP